jgi:hypothetical protein
MNRIAIVDFARALHSGLEQRVHLAVKDPSAYVDAYRAELELRGVDAPEDGLAVLALIDGLIESGRAAELDWREDPSVVVEEIGALVSLPDGERIAANLVDSIDADETSKVTDALRAVDALIETEGLTLRVIDIGSDSYPTLVIRSEAAARLDALALAAGVTWGLQV